MFKRQFYALEHSNRGDSASSSSSSSLATASDGDGAADVQDDAAWPASSHESDSSSQEEVVEAQGATSVERTLVPPHEVSGDCADESDDDVEGDVSDVETEEKKRNLKKQWAEAVEDDETERVLGKFEDSSVICVGSNKPVFRCRLCPKVLCLTEEFMEAHLSSKGHARSLKQLAEGRLRVRLGSDGEEEEEEEDGETHAERHARTVLTAQEEKAPKRKRDSGRQRQRKRLKKKALMTAKKGKTDKDMSQALLATMKVKKKSRVPIKSDRKEADDKAVRKQKKFPPTSAGVEKGKSAQKQPSKSDRRNLIFRSNVNRTNGVVKKSGLIRSQVNTR